MPTDVVSFERSASLSKAHQRSREKSMPNEFKFPYITNSGRDLAGDILNYLYENLNPKAKVQSRQELLNLGSFIKFNQKEFHLGDSSLADEGFLFIPKDLKSNAKLHIVLHGAGQDVSRVGTAYVEDTGYIEWAATNNILLLFP